MYKDIFFVTLQILFVTLIIFFYFSEENITKINKSRSKNYNQIHVNINNITKNSSIKPQLILLNICLNQIMIIKKNTINFLNL